MSSAVSVLERPLDAPGRDERPGLGRLTRSELRKMYDTRAGFWLLVAVAAITVVAVVIFCLAAEPVDRTLKNMLAVATTPASILLPVVGILLVSSEWSQRTALITFALVPQRSRVVAAKLLASVVLAVTAFAIAVAAALVATAVAGGGLPGTWSLPAGLIGQMAFALATAMITGVGFGAVLLSSAPAIVIYFALPTAWSALGSIPALEGAARWLDTSRALNPLTDHLMSGLEWARAATALALWMLLPVLIGLWRIARAEVRSA